MNFSVEITEEVFLSICPDDVKRFHYESFGNIVKDYYNSKGVISYKVNKGTWFLG